NPPRCGLLVKNLLQLVAERLALRNHLRQLMTPDRLTKGCLRAQSNRLDKILNFQNRLLRTPDQPEDNRIDVHRNRIASQGRLGTDRRNAHPLIHVTAQRLNDRDNKKETRPAQTAISAEAQQSHLLPLIDYLDSEEKVNSHHAA